MAQRPQRQVHQVDWSEDESEIRLRCACHSETLSVTAFVDGDDDFLYLTMETRAYRGRLSWGTRLRHIWRILRRGEPYEDQMLLHLDTAQEFGALLQQLAKRVREKYQQIQSEKGKSI